MVGLGGVAAIGGLSVRLQRAYATTSTSGLVFVAHRGHSVHYCRSGNSITESEVLADYATAVQMLVLESDWRLPPIERVGTVVLPQDAQHAGVMYGCPPEVVGHVTYACVWDIRMVPPQRTCSHHDRDFTVSAGDHFTVRSSTPFFSTRVCDITFLVLGFATKNHRPWQVHTLLNFNLYYYGYGSFITTIASLLSFHYNTCL